MALRESQTDTTVDDDSEQIPQDTESVKEQKQGEQST